MKELTDEMVQKSINSDNFIGIIMLIILLIFTIIFICMMIGLKIQLKEEQEEKKAKDLKNNIIGLFVATIIFSLLDLGCIFMIKDSYGNKDNWRIEIDTITSLSHYTDYETDSNIGNEVYEARVGEYSRRIKISEEEYNNLEKGDKVYVVIKGESLVVDLWDTKEYKYVGDKLK